LCQHELELNYTNVRNMLSRAKKVTEFEVFTLTR